MDLSKLANLLQCDDVGLDLPYQSVSIDTRTLTKGDVYIAIKGDRFDGHDFVEQAKKQGAVAAIVEKKVDIDLPQLVVEDTRHALYQIAQFHRDQFQIPVVGITGSCGKTTTRAMIQSILNQKNNVLAAERSFNNEIGVPLTLLRLSESHECAVIEMGANHQGEIALLTALVKPTVAVLTCAAAAHLEGFGGMVGVSRGKGEIFQGLPADGVAVINADDQYADYWRSLIKETQRTITFGMQSPADVTASHIQLDRQGCSVFKLNAFGKSCDIHLPFMGEHNIKNALAAAAAALALNIALTDIKAGLEQARPESGRLIERQGLHGATIIDDSYNANPTSVAAAIDILTARDGDGILVLGDMLEMGDEAASLHEQIGALAKQKGLGRLYCYGPLTTHSVHAFGKHAQHFNSHDALIDALKPELSMHTTVLVKGSNSMGMQAVVRALAV